MKIMFIGGPYSPALTVGKIYSLPKRHLNFAWFEPAPDNAKVGDVIAGVKYVSVPNPIPQPQPEYHTNRAVPCDMKTKAAMVFRGGKNAPSGFKVGKTYTLPLRLARFKWFQLA